jgi:hypothetical protein
VTTVNTSSTFESTGRHPRGLRFLTIAAFALAIVVASVSGGAAQTQAASPSTTSAPALSKTCRVIQADIKVARKHMTEASMAGNAAEWQQEWADHRWELLELSMEHDCSLDGNGNDRCVAGRRLAAFSETTGAPRQVQDV